MGYVKIWDILQFPEGGGGHSKMVPQVQQENTCKACSNVNGQQNVDCICLQVSVYRN